MTAILRAWNPLESLIMSQPVSRRRSKRLAAYDEEDGDFIFTRGAKKAKIKNPEAEAPPFSTPSAPVVKRGRKPKEPSRERENGIGSTLKKDKDRKANSSTSTRGLDSSIALRKKRTTRSSIDKTQIENAPNQSSAYHGSQATADKVNFKYAGAQFQYKQSTIISLPMSDTPVINRNKELRKKVGNSTRRSSLGLRGRRASSLIDNGHSAIPHREVETSDFYKHIEADGLSEPRRMKQLLTWTGERCLGPKPSHGNSETAAELAARHVKESLLKDLSEKSELSDWFNRELARATVVKKPNPRNIELENGLQAIEARLKILRDERDKWRELAKPPPLLPPILPQGTIERDASLIDSSLLDPEQAAILAEVSSHSAHDLRKQASDRLKVLQSRLELQVDQLADGLHKIDMYQETVGRVADKILCFSALKLEERDKREKEKIGTRDIPMQEVLRSLSRILPERNIQN